MSESQKRNLFVCFKPKHKPNIIRLNWVPGDRDHVVVAAAHARLLLPQVMDYEELPQVAHLLEGAGRRGRAGLGPLQQLVEEGARVGVVLQQEGLVTQRVEDVVFGEAPAQTTIDLRETRPLWLRLQMSPVTLLLFTVTPRLQWHFEQVCLQ